MAEQAGNDLTVCRPSELSENDRKRFIDLVAEGGAVSRKSAAENLPKCLLVAVLKRDGQMVAVGSIKGERTSYTATISKTSGHELGNAARELGYVAVDTAFRDQHLSTAVVQKLVETYGGQLFATTHEAKMKSALKHWNWIEEVKAWNSKTAQEKKLSFWVSGPASPHT
jgi:hypothetical protein